MALDLGQLWNDFTDSVVPLLPDFFTDDDVIEGTFTNVPPTGGTGMACGTGGSKRVLGYLDSNGNFCKKKSRRRRNRLATASDIKDIASLKSVLGGGKALDTWIATHK